MVTWSCQILGCASQLIVRSSQLWMKMNPWVMTTWGNQWILIVLCPIQQMVEDGEVNTNSFNTGRWTGENWYTYVQFTYWGLHQSLWFLLCLDNILYWSLPGRELILFVYNVQHDCFLLAFLTLNLCLCRHSQLLGHRIILLQRFC